MAAILNILNGGYHKNQVTCPHKKDSHVDKSHSIYYVILIITYYQYTKFHAVMTIWTILPLTAPLSYNPAHAQYVSKMPGLVVVMHVTECPWYLIHLYDAELSNINTIMPPPPPRVNIFVKMKFDPIPTHCSTSLWNSELVSQFLFLWTDQMLAYITNSIMIRSPVFTFVFTQKVFRNFFG